MAVRPITVQDARRYASLPSQFPSTHPKLAGRYSNIESENSGRFRDLCKKVSAIIPNRITEAQSKMVSIFSDLPFPTRLDKIRILKCLPLVFLMGCEAQAPTGQVVATLPNSEITLRELEHEVRLTNQASQRAALESLIGRKVLAAEAVTRELNLAEDFHFALRKTRDDMLVEMLKENIAKQLPPMLEKEIWIAINREPWRYKNRMRLYLTRNDENGERTVFWIDTADYNEDLPSDVYLVEPGEVLTLNGQDWNVHLKETLVAPPERMLQAARVEIRAKQVQAEIELIIENYRQTRQIVYNKGYGSAMANPSKVDQKE